MLYYQTGGKGQVTEDIRQLGTFRETAKATELKLYLPVRERQKLNEEGKRVYFIETLNI